MVSDAPSAITRALERDEGLEILVDMMAVSRRFHFFVLACDTPRVTRAALTFIRARIEIERGAAVQMHWLDPHAAADVGLDRPLAPEQLIPATLPRLLHPEGQGEPGDDLLVLDASRALRDDDRAWNLLFQRMNEQRNSIARALRGSLVLCVPPRLEVVFARAAPDFWSIRSLAISLAISPPSAPRVGFLQELLRTTPVVTPEWLRKFGRSGDLSARAYDLRQDVHTRVHALTGLTLQHLVGGHPKAALRHAEDCLALTKPDDEPDPEQYWRIECRRWLAWTLCVLGETEHAREAIAEFVARARRGFGREPRRDLASVLRDQAEINLCCERYSAAENAATEAVRLAEGVLITGPNLQDTRMILAMNLQCLGDVTYALGDHERAMSAYQGALRHHMDIVTRHADSGDNLLRAAESLLRLGLVSWTRSSVAAGLDPCLEAVALLRQILERAPERGDVAHTLAVHLGNLGDMHRERGDPARAGLAYAESLRLCLELRARDAHNVFWRHTLATSLMRRARHIEHEPRGVLHDAVDAWQAAQTELTSLLAEAPARSDWARLLAECTGEQARVAALLAGPR